MYIGVDLGGTNIGIGIVNGQGEIVAQIDAPTHKERPFVEIAQDILMLIRKLISDNEATDIKALGLGVPGTVDIEKGAFVSAPNINVDNFNMKEMFERELGIPTFVDNDAKCAALAEAVFGAAKGYDNSITVTLGTGIGTGIIIDKRIFRGLANCAGETGHMVIRQDGKQCGCGRKGCWEQYASSVALNRMVREAAEKDENSLINKLAEGDYRKINSRLVFEAAEQGDKVASVVLNEYFNNLSEGLANIINIMAPQIIVIGGGISKQGERLLQPIREFISHNTQCKNVKLPLIVGAKFGREAGILGASILGMQERS